MTISRSDIHIKDGVGAIQASRVNALLETEFRNPLPGPPKDCACCRLVRAEWLLVSTIRAHSYMPILVPLCNRCFRNPGRDYPPHARDQGWMKIPDATR